MNEQIRSQWAADLVGQTLSGSVNDPVTGDTGSYQWKIDNVTWDGYSDYLTVFLTNNSIGWRGYRFTDTDTTPAAISLMHERLAGEVYWELERARFANLVGGVV